MTQRTIAVTLALACALCGCATTPSSRPGVMSPMPGGTAATTAKPGDEIPVPVPVPVSVPVGTTSSGGSIRATAPRAAVPVDSLPSADALTVLASIPDPLPPGQRVPPPATPSGTATNGGRGISAPAPDAAYDTLRTRAPEDDGDVPIPSPTRALGDRPASSPVVPDGVAPPAAPPPSAPPPSAAPPASPPPAAAAMPDTCWRVQFAAPEERERADGLRAAVESQLSLPAVVEAEARRFKVRTRDCMSQADAELLKNRAAMAGFDGAFRFVWKKP